MQQITPDRWSLKKLEKLARMADISISARMKEKERAALKVIPVGTIIRASLSSRQKNKSVLVVEGFDPLSNRLLCRFVESEKKSHISIAIKNETIEMQQ